jgi:hypothetical protein
MSTATTVRPMTGNRARWPAALPVQSQAVVFRDDLQQRAERLWPEHLPNWQQNRVEWLRAVAVVRSTKTGWQADVRERSHG